MFKPRVLFLVKRRNLTYTPPFGLLYSANFVADLLHRHHIDAKVVQVTDGNDIDKEVVNFNPTHVIMEALWATPAKIRELLNLPRHSNRTWIIRLHSKPSFLAMEGMAMEWLGELAELSRKHHNLKLSANHEGANSEYSKVFRVPFLFLPNYYFLGNQQPLTHHRNSIHIGCFGALRPLKNHLLQAFGAILYANKRNLPLHFYVNSTRIEQHAEPVFKNLKALFHAQPHHTLVEVPWLSHNDFLKVVANMDLGLQVSFSDSFNIVAADFASTGIPLVVSDEIFWMPDRFKASSTDAEDIACRLAYVHSLPKFYSRFLMRRGLRMYNEVSEDAWLDFIRKK